MGSMDLDQIVADAQKAFEQATDITTLENEKARFLGKSGALTELLKGLGKLDPETRKTEGARINLVKQQVEAALTARRQALADALLNQRLAAEAIDVTLPGRGTGAGSLHPVMRTFERDDIQVRFRPSYFPFTEPSAEIDMLFETGKNAGKWLEISGSGQVHPTVIRNMGLDPERYIGFAFGSGLERLTMLRYGVQDLRLFFENDLRFLRQFAWT